MPDELFHPDLCEDALERWAHATVATLQGGGCAALVIGGGQPAPGVRSTELITRLAQATEIVLAHHPAARLLIEGGGTASAVLRRLGWLRLTVPHSSSAGVGVGVPVGRDGPEIYIKPGSYAWPVEILPAAKLPSFEPPPHSSALART